MKRKFMLAWLWAVSVLIAGSAVSYATIDRTPTTTVGAVFVTSPGTSATGEYDSLHMSSDKRLLVNAAGVAADGAAVSGNPVLTAGTDGTNAQTISVDTSGRQLAVGAAADGVATAGNPVLIGGDDGTNAQNLNVDTSGRPRVVGAVADGAAVAGNPVQVAGTDGTNAQTLSVDTSGRLSTVGAAADGAAVAGNPVLVAGTDGTNAQTLSVDTSGRPNIVGAAATGAASAGNPVLVAGVNVAAGTVRRLSLATTGEDAVNSEFLLVGGLNGSSNCRGLGVGAAGDTSPANCIMPGVSDGSTAIRRLRGSAGGVMSMGLFYEADTVTAIPTTNSNGTTAVQLIALAASQTIYVLSMVFYNDSGIARTVTLQDSTGPTKIYEFRLGPDQSAVIDGRGDYRTGSGEALQFVLDGGTTGVKVSGAVIQR